MPTADPHETPDVPQQAGDVITGPTIDKPVHANRDVNIATNQVVNNVPPAPDAVRAAWLIALAAYYGAALPAPGAAVDDAPYIAALQASFPDPLALLSATRQVMVGGLIDDWPQPDALPPAALSAELARARTAFLLMPFIDAYTFDLPGPWPYALAVLASPALRDLVFATWQAYYQEQVPGERIAIKARFVQQLDAPEHREGLQRLLVYLAARWDTLVLERQNLLRERRVAPRPRPNERAALLKLLVASAGGALGGTLGTAAVVAAAADLAIHGDQALVTQLWQRLAELSTAPAEPARPPAPPAPQPLRASGRDDIPVTPDEWRAELARRSTVFGRPNGYWCYVQPGTYRIGGWKKGDEWADIALDGFWIAKFPITNAQFAPFVREGYSESARRFWTPNGWAWKTKVKRAQPDRWGEQNFNGPRQPVVSIAWYEAATYSAWLDSQIASTLPGGYALRLPGEAEWEAAAAFEAPGRAHRTYPWGEPPLTPERAAYGGKWEAGPPQVGMYPDGAAACGTLDMVGTVWECASSDYDTYPKGSAKQQKDFTVDDYRIPWRGGSWGNDSTYVRCGARNRNPPGYWVNYYGFRVVVAPRRVR